MEYERTYLIDSLPKELAKVLPEEMVDVYIPNEMNHAHLRLRKRGAKYCITKKMATDLGAAVHSEETIELSPAEFENLAKCSDLVIRKKRYARRFPEYLLEVDVFSGIHAGLMLADFEFDSLEKMQKFTPPAFVLCDVTEDKFIAGGMLCSKSRTEVLAWLEANC